MSTITEFLLARIAEDEAMARAADVKQGDPSWRASKHVEGATVRSGRDNRPVARVQYLPSDEDDGPCSTGIIDPHAVANHIARHDPVRVLAECAAKRAIVESHADGGESQGWMWDGSYGGYDHACTTCGTFGEYGEPWPCYTLRTLASIYADHPDYDQAWRQVLHP